MKCEPSELKTPVPNRDCKAARNSSPFSYSSKCVESIICQDMVKSVSVLVISTTLDVTLRYCGSVVTIYNHNQHWQVEGHTVQTYVGFP